MTDYLLALQPCIAQLAALRKSLLNSCDSFVVIGSLNVWPIPARFRKSGDYLAATACKDQKQQSWVVGVWDLLHIAIDSKEVRLQNWLLPADFSETQSVKVTMSCQKSSLKCNSVSKTRLSLAGDYQSTTSASAVGWRDLGAFLGRQLTPLQPFSSTWQTGWLTKRAIERRISQHRQPEGMSG